MIILDGIDTFQTQDANMISHSGIFCVHPRIHTTNGVWNQGYAQKIPTAGFNVKA